MTRHTCPRRLDTHHTYAQESERVKRDSQQGKGTEAKVTHGIN
jgi:hypothetical protein